MLDLIYSDETRAAIRNRVTGFGQSRAGRVLRAGMWIAITNTMGALAQAGINEVLDHKGMGNRRMMFYGTNIQQQR